MKNIFCLYQLHSNWARSNSRLFPPPLLWCSPFNVWLNLISIATRDLRCIVVFSPIHILLQLRSPWGQPLACSLHSGFCRSTALVVSHSHSSNSFRLHRQNPTLEIKTLNNQFVEQKHLQFPMLLLLMQKVLWLPSALNSIIPVFYPHEISFLDQINFPGIFNFSCVFFFRKCAHCPFKIHKF